MTIDGADVAEAPQPGLLFFPNLSTSGVGMLIGRDRGLSVSNDYRPPFPFTGTILRVELASAAPRARPDPSVEMRAAFAAD